MLEEIGRRSIIFKPFQNEASKTRAVLVIAARASVMLQAWPNMNTLPEPHHRA
jgi:hypothetical protein